MRFKVGDTVRLKSGGPIMTVIETRVEDETLEVVHVGWFNLKGNIKSDEVSADILEKAEPVNPEKLAKDLIRDLTSGVMAGMGPLPGLDLKEQS